MNLSSIRSYCLYNKCHKKITIPQSESEKYLVGLAGPVQNNNVKRDGNQLKRIINAAMLENN